MCPKRRLRIDFLLVQASDDFATGGVNTEGAADFAGLGRRSSARLRPEVAGAHKLVSVIGQGQLFNARRPRRCLLDEECSWALIEDVQQRRVVGPYLACGELTCADAGDEGQSSAALYTCILPTGVTAVPAALS